jgi:hypothetical protein
MSNQPEREIIVTSDGGSGVGMVLAAVILVLGIIAAIWYFNSSGSADSLPEEINVNIDTGSDPGTETTIVP